MSEREQRDRFKMMVLAAASVSTLGIEACAMHGRGDCDGDLEAHHVVTQQQLRNAGRHDILWDWRNGLALCNGHHRRHTRAIERVAYAALPQRCRTFAETHGFGDVLTRYYTQEDA